MSLDRLWPTNHTFPLAVVIIDLGMTDSPLSPSAKALSSSSNSVSYGSLDRLREMRRQVGRSRASHNSNSSFDASSIERSAAALQAKNEYLRTLGPVPKSSAVRPASACSAPLSTSRSGKTSSPPTDDGESLTEPLHKVVRSLWDAAHAKQQAEWEALEPRTRLPFTIASLSSFAAVITGIVPLAPKLAEFFSAFAKAISDASAEAAEMQLSLVACTEELHRVHGAVELKISDLRAQADAKVRTAVNSLLNRDDELASLAALNTSMGSRLKSLEAECSALRDQLSASQNKEEDYRNDVNVKRTQVQLFQAKMNTVLQENMYLREIAKHNRDLLLEIDALKDQLAEATTAKAAEVDAAVAAKSQAYFEIQAAKLASKKLVAALRAAEEDVNRLRRQHDLDESFHSKCKADRDNMVAHRTPRPRKGDAVLALQGAWKVLGDEGMSKDSQDRLATTDLLEATTLALAKLTTLTKQLKSKAETDQRLLEYVAGDDFEVVSRALQSADAGPLGEGTLVRRGNGAETKSATSAWTSAAVVPFPLHSRVVVLDGPWAALGLTKGLHRVMTLETGRVGCRTMALEELLLMIDKLLADRRAAEGVGVLVVPWSATIRTSLQRAYNLTMPQLVEAMATLEYSLELFSFIPQVELFKKIVQREAPDELYGEIITLIDKLCRACTDTKDFRTVQLSKSSTLRLMKRAQFVGFLQRAIPQVSDTDLFRLLAVAASETLGKMGSADAKAAQNVLSGKDDVPLDVLLVAPDGKNGDDFQGTVALGAPSTRSVLAVYRKPGTSVLPPFLSAVFRLIAQQYELATQHLALELGGPTASAAQAPQADLSLLSQNRGATVSKERLVRALTSSGVAQQVADAVGDTALDRHNLTALTRSEQPTLANVCAVLRCCFIRFGKAAGAGAQLSEITGPMDPAKLVDAAKKNILGLRGAV